MKTLNTITRTVICAVAVALAIGALRHNPAHLFTAAAIFAIGMNVEWKKKEDKI